MIVRKVYQRKEYLERKQETIIIIIIIIIII